MSKKKTQEEFKSQVKALHPDIEVIGEYVNKTHKLLVKDKYGLLLVNPYRLITPSNPTISLALDKTAYFKAMLKDLHINTEILGVYINSTRKLLAKDRYGICITTPRNILRRRGLSIISAINKTDYLKAQVREVHPDISVIGEYVSMKSKILIRNKYGILNVFTYTLLNNFNKSIKSAMDKTEYFINKSTIIHNGIYSYDDVEYIDDDIKVKIYCNECKVYFYQRPSSHLKGSGCPNCNHTGWSRDEYMKAAKGRQAILYKIKCWNDRESFYKIGITYLGLKSRFNRGIAMPYKYKTVSILQGSAGYIYDLEDKEHRKHKRFEYEPKLHFGGKTECFSKLL